MKSVVKIAGTAVVSGVVTLCGLALWALYDEVQEKKAEIFKRTKKTSAFSCDQTCACQCNMVGCGCHEKIRTPKKTGIRPVNWDGPNGARFYRS